MTERENINLDNFEQLCPLIKDGWRLLIPITRNIQGINLLLTKDFGKFQNKEAEDAAATAVGLTCLNCVYAHSSPCTKTICLSTQGVPEHNPIATVYIQVTEMNT